MIFLSNSSKYLLLFKAMSLISLLISHKYFKTHEGEFWCLFVVIIPFCLLMIQYIETLYITFYKDNYKDEKETKK